GSSWPQSTRIVQLKRRPTSNVDSMMVLRARRGGTGSKYVTLRGGLRRAIPFLLVRSDVGAPGPQFYATKRCRAPTHRARRIDPRVILKGEPRRCRAITAQYRRAGVCQHVAAAGNINLPSVNHLTAFRWR